MNIADTLLQVKNRLADGDIFGAIDLLKTLLDSDRRFAQLARMLRVIESNFQSARQAEQLGKLTFSEAKSKYAKTTDALLGLLESVETGKTTIQTPAKKMQRGLWIVLAVAGLAFLGILFFWSKFRVDCPDFADDSKLKVLVLPFANLNESKLKIEVALGEQIEALATKRNLPADAEIHTKYNGVIENIDKNKAARAAGQCAADLVVWGSQLKMDGDSLRVRVQFKFSDEQKTGDSGYQTLKEFDLLGGTFDRGLKDVAFALCARLAILNGNNDLAKSWLQKMQQTSQAEQRFLEKPGG